MKCEVARIVDQFRRSHDGDPWRGSSLAAILDGVTAKPAAQPPGATCSELFHGVVQHDAYHAGEIAIRKRILG